MALPAIDDVSKAAIRRQLELIDRSSAFDGTRVARDMFRHLVEETLAGRSPSEWDIALGFLKRDPESYDVKKTGAIRVQIKRIRQKLAAYYAFEGASDPVKISIPIGSFAAQFEFRTVLASMEAPYVVQSRIKRPGLHRATLTAAMVHIREDAGCRIPSYVVHQLCPNGLPEDDDPPLSVNHDSDGPMAESEYIRPLPRWLLSAPLFHRFGAPPTTPEKLTTTLQTFKSGGHALYGPVNFLFLPKVFSAWLPEGKHEVCVVTTLDAADLGERRIMRIYRPLDWQRAREKMSTQAWNLAKIQTAQVPVSSAQEISEHLFPPARRPSEYLPIWAEHIFHCGVLLPDKSPDIPLYSLCPSIEFYAWYEQDHIACCSVAAFPELKTAFSE